MKLMTTVLLALTCLAAGGVRAQAAITAGAPEPADEASLTVTESSGSQGALVSLSFDDTPLSDVIRAFRDATGANIISSGTNLHNAVSVRLDNVPWREGLASILDPQAMQLVERPAGSGIFVVEPKPVIEIPKVTRTFDLEFARAGDVTNLLMRTFGTTCTVASFSAANVIIFTGTEQQLGECEKILQAIDKPRRQVFIEARFVEMSAAAYKKLGLKWDTLGAEDGWGVGTSDIRAGMERNKARISAFPTGVKTASSGSAGNEAGGSSQLTETFLVPKELVGAPNAGRLAEDMSWKRARGVGGQISADDFRLALNAFEGLDDVSIFSNPKIIVANEETAMVDMTKKEPNVSVKSSRTGTAGDQLDVSTDLTVIPGEKEPFVGEAFFSYGIRLKVVPRISASGQITVDIEPSVSDKIGSYTIAGVSKDTPVGTYPIIDMKRIQTVFTMQDGCTAVIGGLSRTTEGNQENGIPLLRKIPWIGPRLFGWKSRSREQREIVIFVTVGIADPLDLPEDIGMPKNAVLSREILEGKVKEPGDRTREELLSIEDPKPAAPQVESAAPEVETAKPLLTD